MNTHGEYQMQQKWSELAEYHLNNILKTLKLAENKQ
jgi:hypothetical protein